MLKVGVAVPTYMRDGVLVHTLERLFQQTRPPNEIIVIDQTDQHDDLTTAYLNDKQKKGGLRVIKQKVPNLPAARNRALEETVSDVLIFVDDDVNVPFDFIERHALNFEQDPTVSAVAGRVIECARRRSKKKCWPRVADFLYFDFNSDRRSEGIAIFKGCNHSLRVKDVMAIGGYDENFRGVAIREEADLALRLYLKGFKVVFDPSSSLEHFALPLGGCRPESRTDVSRSRSMIYFAFKNLQGLKFYAVVELWKALRGDVLNKKTVNRPDVLFVNALKYGLNVAGFIPLLFRARRAQE